MPKGGKVKIREGKREKRKTVEQGGEEKVGSKREIFRGF